MQEAVFLKKIQNKVPKNIRFMFQYVHSDPKLPHWVTCHSTHIVNFNYRLINYRLPIGLMLHNILLVRIRPTRVSCSPVDFKRRKRSVLAVSCTRNQDALKNSASIQKNVKHTLQRCSNLTCFLQYRSIFETAELLSYYCVSTVTNCT